MNRRWERFPPQTFSRHLSCPVIKDSNCKVGWDSSYRIREYLRWKTHSNIRIWEFSWAHKSTYYLGTLTKVTCSWLGGLEFEFSSGFWRLSKTASNFSAALFRFFSLPSTLRCVSMHFSENFGSTNRAWIFMPWKSRLIFSIALM